MVVVLFGTGFITISGILLQSRLNVSQQKLEFYKTRLENSYRVVDEFSDVLSVRLYRLNQIIWSLKGTTNNDSDKILENYYLAIEKWNVALLSYKMRLKRYVGNEIVDSLVNEQNYGDTKTIHGKFMFAHEQVLKVMRCRDCTPSDKESLIKEVEITIKDLGDLIGRFIDRAYAVIESGKGDMAV